MTRLRIVAVAAALVFWTAGSGGCAPEGWSDHVALPDESGSPESAGTDTDGGATEPGEAPGKTLGELAAELVADDDGAAPALWDGYESVSTSGHYQPPTYYPPGYNPYTRDDSGDGGSVGSLGADGSGGSRGWDGSDGGGGSGGALAGSGCTPESGWLGWPGDYNGTVDCQETESLAGYGESGKDMTFCISMSFDDAGVPDWIPIPVFAPVSDPLLQVDLRFAGESGVFAAWIYDIVVTVVSATYTQTTADVQLEIDLQWIGDSSSIMARGTHTLHTEVVGDSLVYSSQTHYDGSFWADADDDDWEADATQDFDCSATLTKP